MRSQTVKNKAVKIFHFLIGMTFVAALMLGSSCESPAGGDDDDNLTSSKNGLALETAKGHLFEFYHTSGNWYCSFSVDHSGNTAVNFPNNGWMLDSKPSFSYYKIEKDDASVIVFVGLKTFMSTGWIYNYAYYSGHYALKFTSAKKGTFIRYDNYSNMDINDPFPTKKIISSGTFEVK